MVIYTNVKRVVIICVAGKYVVRFNRVIIVYVFKVKELLRVMLQRSNYGCRHLCGFIGRHFSGAGNIARFFLSALIMQRLYCFAISFHICFTGSLIAVSYIVV